MTFYTARLGRAISPVLALASVCYTSAARVGDDGIDMKTYKPPDGTVQRAAYDGNVAALKVPLKKQPKKVSAADPPTYFTPLHFAALRGKVEAAKYLISKGANVNAVHKNYGAPVHLAAKNLDLPMLKVLVQHHAGVQSARALYPGATPLILAAAAAVPGRNNAPVVSYLLARGANVNAKDRNGWSAIQHAVARRGAATAEILLEHGADVESPYDERTTLLARAVGYNDLATAKVLLKHGANPTANEQSDNLPANLAPPGARNSSPLAIARADHHPEMVALLEKYVKKQ